MATEKQITLVRNLLALTQSSFPAEAAEAERKAKELILKWGIRETDVLPSRAKPQRTCPGCPNCWPRGGTTVHMYAWYDPSFTTTMGSSGTPLTRVDLERALDDLQDIVRDFRRSDAEDDRN